MQVTVRFSRLYHENGHWLQFIHSFYSLLWEGNSIHGQRHRISRLHCLFVSMSGLLFLPAALHRMLSLVQT